MYVGNEVNISISQKKELKYLDNSSLEPKAKSKINYFQRQIKCMFLCIQSHSLPTNHYSSDYKTSVF